MLNNDIEYESTMANVINYCVNYYLQVKYRPSFNYRYSFEEFL